MNKIKRRIQTLETKIKENEERITKLKEYSKGLPNRVSKKETTRKKKNQKTKKINPRQQKIQKRTKTKKKRTKRTRKNQRKNRHHIRYRQRKSSKKKIQNNIPPTRPI